MRRGHDSELSARLDVARAAADNAGKNSLKYFLGELKRETKADGTIVTIADRQGEQLIRRAVQRAFPGDGILGEEFEERKGDSRYRWIIDPIDGTISFARGVPFYGVLIGIEDQETRGCPAGVIHLPALGETIYAQKGRGCHWTRRKGRYNQTQAAQVSTVSSLEAAMVLATDFWSAPDAGRRAAMHRLAGRAATRRTWADCYGYVLVATGRADVMMDAAMNIWDCAPLQPILEEAGGTFTDWSGKATIYGDCAVATNSKLLAQVLAELSAR